MLVRSLIREPGAEVVDDVLTSASAIVTATVAYAEARAALAAARRARRLTPPRLASTKAALETLWRRVDVIDVDEAIARAGGTVAEIFGLRALDGLHLAAALSLDDAALVFVTCDRPLSAAARRAGLAVAP